MNMWLACKETCPRRLSVSRLIKEGNLTTKQIFYFILCIAGTVLPYSQLVPFALEHGLDPRLFYEQFFANRISSFFGLDVVVSSVALWFFVYWEGTRLKMRNLWIYIASNLLVGVSLGLPLFLLVRQSRLDGIGGSTKSIQQTAD